jgi:hypothetical protein
MDKKYVLTEETLKEEETGLILYRIKATRSSDTFTKGELGGFVSSEENLSHHGNAWVYGNARVTGNARVYGNAQAYGNAWVYGNARVTGNAWVYGNAQAYGNAWVYGNAQATKGVISILGFVWLITVTDNHISIGCVIKTFDEWLNLSDKSALDLDEDAVVYWRHLKDMIPYLVKMYELG